MIQLTTLGLYPNVNKKNLTKLVSGLINWLESRGYSVVLPKDIADVLSISEHSIETEDFFQRIDIAVTLGGDGTLLNVARHVAPYKIPILGINLGHVGFLTEIELADLYTDLERFSKNSYTIDYRMMLETQVVRDGEVLEKFLALNDAVVTKGPFARLIRLKTYANEEYIDTYPADGLIIATPTGSTAYSLSAGGPIIHPNMNLLLLTPICPHTLRSRSIVVSENDVIKVKLLADHPEIMLTVDGQQGYKLLPGDQIIIKKSNFLTRLIRLKERSFYDVLRKKLSE
ncbi:MULTISPECIES: NAD(+)/NADH kinase [Tepidanaerobacter]|uniref:NAD kinase n=1 Tax=Tepidanaerobacter syntrophicus TaxID=224999 RepID=A0A0U9HJM9_9FIRM|nr:MULTISPECIES: NAD(+)/NADH kinase [Tepidanaerobacter]GAQ26132.1 NAD+ kinase [Tepidanaerobacter syntrophicus]HHV82123.1 NAD(+)/NADH kinase [Tepidanaerobacter syntrophicus]